MLRFRWDKKRVLVIDKENPGLTNIIEQGFSMWLPQR